MNVLAAGPFVWCVGPHDHAVIESASSETHHGGHHHDIDVDGVLNDAEAHEDGDACLDLALDHDGQLNALNINFFAPCIIELPTHLDTYYQRSPFSQLSDLWSHAPPERGAVLPLSLIIANDAVLLI